MSTPVAGAFTISFAGVPVDDCYAITRIVETFSDSDVGRWMVLNTNATDVILAGKEIHLDAMSYQIVARLGVDEPTRPGELALSLPVSRDGLIAVLGLARQKLTPGFVVPTPVAEIAQAPQIEDVREPAPAPVAEPVRDAVPDLHQRPHEQAQPEVPAQGFSSLGMPPFAPAPMDSLYQRSTATAPHYQIRPLSNAHAAPPPPSASEEVDEPAPVNSPVAASGPVAEPEIEEVTESALDLESFELEIEEEALELGIETEIGADHAAEPEQSDLPADEAPLHENARAYEAQQSAGRELERTWGARPGFSSWPSSSEPAGRDTYRSEPPRFEQSDPEPSLPEPPVFSPARAGGNGSEWPGSSLRQRLMAHMNDGTSLPSSVAQFIGVTGTAEKSQSKSEPANLDAAEPAPFHGGLGGDVWAEVAMSIYSIMQNSASVIAEVEIAHIGALTVDFRYRAFTSDVAVEDIPSLPVHATIRTTPAQPGTPPAFILPGQSLDKLLWFIGINAFHGAAPWLRNEDRYRLQRWPNFTEMAYEMDHMRMTALMGNAYFNAEELAAASSVPIDTAVRMLNAYSLMGLLQVSEGQAKAAPAVVQPAALPSNSSGGIFSKLRKKLGL